MRVKGTELDESKWSQSLKGVQGTELDGSKRH